MQTIDLRGVRCPTNFIKAKLALDIDRHNVIDKVVGMAVMNGDDLTKVILVSSGRQPVGMVMKAERIKC